MDMVPYLVLDLPLRECVAKIVLIGMSMMTTMMQPNVNTMSGRIGTTAVTEETQRAAAEK